MKDLFQTLGQPLKVHAALLQMGVSTERATQLITNRDLTFKANTMSLTQTFRDQLKKIAESVDVNINALLNMLTVDQITQVIEDHAGVKWSDPDCDDREQSLSLSGITKSEHGVWWLSFTVYPFMDDECSYQLHDLEIQDVLALMQTIENVIIPNLPTNEFKSVKADC